MNFPRNYYPEIALAAITIFGLFLRIYNLGWQCLTVDEVVTSNIAAKPFGYIFHWSLNFDCNPPAYYLLAHGSALLFRGVSAFAIRFPAAILGTLAIPMIYLVGKKIHGETLGLLAASLVSFMFPFVYYSQNARAYSLVVFAFLGFIYFWYMLIDGDRSIITIGQCSAFAALCIWSHYFSAVPISIALLILIFKNAKAVPALLINLSLFALPLVAFLNIRNIFARAAPDAIPGYLQLTPDHQWWTTPTQMSMYLPNELLCWSWLVLLPLAGYSVIKIKVPVVKHFAIIAAGSCLALIALAQISNLSPRYALLISPLLILVAMCPISERINKFHGAKKATLFIGFVFLIFIFNYGSLIELYTFSICPITGGINSVIKIIGG